MDPVILPDLAKTFGPIGALAIWLWWQTRNAPKPPPPPDYHSEWRADVLKLLEEISRTQAAICRDLAVLIDRGERGRDR